MAEEYSLFGESPPPRYEEITKAEPVIETFLPGLKSGEGFHNINDWDELRRLNESCSACPLRTGCRQVVFGDGDESTGVMLVGEGPGQSEDEMGLPFVGKAGQLLDKIIEAAGFSRPKVYITNVVKCRPPGNRLPVPQEIAACRGHLEAQIRLIKPQIRVCLGALATQTIVDNKAKITQVRGKWFTRREVLIMPTYHPAALLRNENLKRPVWEDFKLIRDEARKRGIIA
ncbi:MAG: uracil-DNA glycosylase [Candidatus Saccharibacteria bacterium]